MPITTTRRRLLAGSAAALAFPAFARAQSAKPRITAISQWSAGSDGAAISALGKLFEERGGVWQGGVCSPWCLPVLSIIGVTRW